MNKALIEKLRWRMSFGPGNFGDYHEITEETLLLCKIDRNCRNIGECQLKNEKEYAMCDHEIIANS